MSRRLSSPELIGRAVELARLGTLLAETRARVGQVAVVEGDAGLGKTRLVEEFVAHAGGARVLLGGGIPLAGDVPYAPMIEIFRELALSDTGAGPDRGGAAALFAATAGALREAASSAPVIVVVEDVHWADLSTHGLVSFLARSLRRDPVLLVVTARSEELGAAARAASELVADLGRLPNGHRLVLQPMNRDEVSAQLRGITGVEPAASLVDQLMSRAAGNPFFTEELLAAGTQALPQTVRDVIVARARRLPPAGERILQAAAVLGRVVSHELLAAVADPDDVQPGVQAVTAQRLLDVSGENYVFRHPLIQEAIYADLSPARRRQLHQRAAEAMAAAGPAGTMTDAAGRAVQVAHHWRAAGQTGAALAAAARAAGLAAGANAPAAALAWYEQALTLWPAVPDPAAVARIDETTLLEQAAEAASAAGMNDRAQVLGRRVLSRVDARREPVRAALRWERLGRFCWLAGDQSGSQQAYEQALHVVPDEPSAVRARVLAAMAQSLMLRSRHLESRELAEQAIAIANAVGARAEEAHARNTLGVDLERIGHVEEGIAQLERAAVLARESGDGAELGRYYINLSEILVDARRLGDATRVGLEGIHVTTELGLARVHTPTILASVLYSLYLLGEWDEIATRSADGLAQQAERWSTAPLHLVRGRLALARGESAGVATELAALGDVPGLAGDIQYGVIVEGVRASAAAAAGEWSAAQDIVRDALVKTRPCDAVRLHLELVALGVQLEADEFDDARLSARRVNVGAARGRAEALAADAATMLARTVRAGARRSAQFELLVALTSAHLSRIPGPADPALWARVATDSLADPYLVAQARYHEAAARLTGRGDRREAAEALRAAQAIALRLGATPLLQRLSELAHRARLDIDAAPASRTAPADRVALTPREREVFALLADGLSNAQIARALFISDKTASVHVSNILRKLGATSRVQAAIAAGRLDQRS